MSEKLIISKLVDGSVTVVGELEFGAKGKATLSLKAKGELADELKAAWDEVSALKAIRMKWAEPDPKDPDQSLLKGRDVPKGHADYPRAVADVLSREHGYFATPADLA